MLHRLFFSFCSGAHRVLHSFPTRRSSDLDAASGVVDIFHGIDKAVADTWNNFWKDGKADGIGSNYRQQLYQRSEERFSRNAETDLVCRRLLEKKKRR